MPTQDESRSFTPCRSFTPLARKAVSARIPFGLPATWPQIDGMGRSSTCPFRAAAIRLMRKASGPSTMMVRRFIVPRSPPLHSHFVRRIEACRLLPLMKHNRHSPKKAKRRISGVALRLLAMTSRRAALRPGASIEVHDANSPSTAARRSSRGHCGGNASREHSYFIVGGSSCWKACIRGVSDKAPL